MQAIIADFLNSTCCSDNENNNNGNEPNNKEKEEEVPNSIQNILQLLISKEVEPKDENTIPKVVKTAGSTTAAASAISTPPTVFRLPISYLPEEDRHTLSKPVVEDLELITAKDTQTTRSLYSRLTDANNKASSVYGRQFLHLWSETFTTNVAFLRATQRVIASFRAELE